MNKFEYLQCFLSFNSPDLVFITETWLSAKIHDSEIVASLPYHVLRSDRGTGRGGGVCCVAKGNLLVRQLPITCSTKSDILCLELFPSEGASCTRIILVYRPPNSTRADDEALIERLHELVSVQPSSVILGDFNLKIDWENLNALNSASSKFLEFFRASSLRQYVLTPTLGCHALDLVLSNCSNIADVSILPPLSTSDHAIVCFNMAGVSLSSLFFPVPDFINADYKGLDKYFSRIDWLKLFNDYSTVAEVYLRFCRVVYCALSFFVPFKTKFLSTFKYPKQIANLIEQKKRLFHQLENPLSNSLYKQVCFDLEAHLRKFHANRERRLANRTSLSKLHQYIRYRIKRNTSVPILIDENGRSCSKDCEKAEALGRYFASVFSTYVSSETRKQITESGTRRFGMSKIYFHPEEVSSVLKKLNPSPGEPYDGIPQIVYRRCYKSLSKPLSFIFNISFLLGDVPQLWKEALVTPIPKVSENNLLSNFRPISLTPTPVKVMEKIISDRVLNFLNKNGMIPAEQHGFLPGASTLTNLLDSYYDWTCALNEGKFLDIFYFDLSKAFDRVSHSKLLTCLQSLGVHGNLLKWLESYLHERYMTVRVKNSYSTRYQCTSGVPQGGVLSPLLFLMYTIELPMLLKTHPDIRVQMYADDIKLYCAYTQDSSSEISSALRTSIARLVSWTSDHSIPLNLNKSMVLHLGGSNVTEYEINGVKLNSCSLARDLGVTIDTKLNFSVHVDYIVKKALATLFALFRNTRCTDAATLVRLYKAYVLPHLEYCSQLWCPVLKKDALKIERVQQIFTRLLWYRTLGEMRGSTLPSYSERLNLFSLDSLQYRRILADLVFCFRLLRGETKLKASKYWVFMPTSLRRNRFILQYRKIHKRNYSRMFNTVFCRCARWFRRIPPELFVADSSEAFKGKLKKLDLFHLLNEQRVYL